MGVSKEQDIAEFDKWWQEYGLGDYDTQLEAWIAARRAPVAPHGWKLVPVEPTLEMKRAGMSERHDDLSRSVYQAMLAAAPQPTDTAPVQLPEPVAAESRFTSFSGDRWRWCTVEHARAFGQDKGYEVRYLYTEHQVRQLLANHAEAKR